MAQTVSATIKGPNGPLDLVLGQATPEQQAPCYELAAAAFVPQISPSVIVEHGESVSQHPLVRNNGSRFWCISLANDPLTVIAMCGTLYRPLLVRDSQSMREEKGYCIFMVATHTQYRRLGLAKMIMKQVTEWLDGAGGAAASMLYTSVGDVSVVTQVQMGVGWCADRCLSQFYVGMGWDMLPCIVSTITNLTGSFQASDHKSLPSSRLLSNDEIPELCNRDVKDLKDNFEKATVSADEVHLAVLPTPDMINYLQNWGDVLTLKMQGKTPEVHGAICEAADTWIYWHHSIDKLVITRVRTPPGNNQASSEALASLFLYALAEAQKLGLSKVTVWEPSVELLGGLELIKKGSSIEVQTGPRSNSITSVRWKDSDKTKKIILHLNESYAAS